MEAFGAEGPAQDAEIISLAKHIFDLFGLEGIRLELNSIGCPACRREFQNALRAYFEGYKSQLCETCLGRLERNPMRILDCKSPECKKIAEGAPRMLDYLDDECRTAFEELKNLLDVYGVPYEVDPGIVRGLDYYTKTAFEFVSDKLGAQSTVCGGGRYDDLIEELGGPATPGVGFGLGIERLLLIMEACGTLPKDEPRCDILVTGLGEAAKTKALELTKQMRDAGKRVIIDVMDRGLKAQFKYADRIGARYVAVIGDDELAKGVVSLRDMEKSSQTEVPADKVIEVLNG